MTGIIQSLLMGYGGAAAAATDADFEYVTMLLPGNGTNGAQNNTFLDSSSNNFTITRNGNTTQGTFSPYGDNWSNYFDGTGDYLSNTSAALITASVSTFTAEGWIYMAANPTTDANNISGFVSLDGQAAGTFNYLAFGPNSSRVLYLRWFDGAGKTASGSTTLNLNQWYHIACVVNSNSIQFYVNGVAETMSGTTTLTNRNGTSGNFAVGANNYGAITGYISNLRVTTTAVYTAAFTPPTAPLTAITNTSLLTCQSNRFRDTSSNAYALTPAGDTSVQRFSPFSPTAAYASGTIGGSGYFDGTGDYLSAAANTAFNPGTSTTPFSIECWLYPTSTPAENRAVYGNFKVISYPSNCDGFDMLYATNRTLVLRWGYPTYADSGGSAAMNLNTWNHLVICRNSSGSMSGFLNGARWFNTSSNTSITNSTAASFWIGWAGDLSGSTIPPFPGYISGFKMLKGTSAYDPTQTTLTVPTAPPTNTTDTSLLLNFTNAGIIDNAMMNDLETVGNAQISTSVSKFGGSSMYFDGTGDWLLAPNSANLAFNTGDFTVECWVYPTASPSYACIIDTRNGFGTGGFGLFITSGTGLQIFTSSGVTIFTGTSCITTNTWQHVVVCRSGTSLRVFVNGTQIGSTVTNSANMSDGYLIIGNALAADRNYPLTGYIDDLRFTKGVARYTANFTAPTAAFPTS